MHEHMAVVFQCQWPLAQPVDQLLAVGRVEDFGQGVGRMLGPDAVGHGQQVQVMVAQDAVGQALPRQRMNVAQGGQRGRAAIDQVAREQQAVRAIRRRLDPFDQFDGLCMAALQIADKISFHMCRGEVDYAPAL